MDPFVNKGPVQKENEELELLKTGDIEIELLRRYGKIPVGTRCTGLFRLWRSAGVYFTHVYEIHVPIANDPRPIQGQVYFSRDQGEDEPNTRGVFYRGVWLTITSANLFDCVVQDVIRYVEGLDTSSKHQRFRVIRAEWQPDQ